MNNYLTVVYKINDPESFEAKRLDILSSMKEDDSLPYCVTAASVDHEILRLQLIEEAINEGDSYLIEDIISCANIANYNSLDEFKKRDND